MFVPVTSSSISMSRLLVSSRRVCGLLTWGRSCSGSLERGVSKTGKELTVVVSTLRVDTVAAAGLDISRKHIWVACLEGLVMLNGEPVIKKSSKVCMGDVIEVDRVLETGVVRRGRLVVKEIGSRTRRGGYHISVIRYKTFALFHRSGQQ